LIISGEYGAPHAVPTPPPSPAAAKDDDDDDAANRAGVAATKGEEDGEDGVDVPSPPPGRLAKEAKAAATMAPPALVKRRPPVSVYQCANANFFGQLGGFEVLLARLERGTPQSIESSDAASSSAVLSMQRATLSEIDASIDFVGCMCEVFTVTLGRTFLPRFRAAIVARYSMLDDEELRTINDTRVSRSIETLSRIESSVRDVSAPVEPGRMAEELDAAIALCKIRSGNVTMNVQGMERLKSLIDEATLKETYDRDEAKPLSHSGVRPHTTESVRVLCFIFVI